MNNSEYLEMLKNRTPVFDDEPNSIVHEEKRRDGTSIKKSYFLENAKFSEPITINGDVCETCESAIKAIAKYINGKEGK